MASSLINIASSGLKTAQVLLATTSNNVSNAYTDGYNRQTVSTAATTGQTTSYGQVGTGVTVLGVNREYDALTMAQLRYATANSEQTSAYYDQISQIDSLLASDDSSIDTLMTSFFSSLQTLSSDASDTSARSAVIGSAQTLVSQLQTIDDYLTSMDTAINQELTTSVDTINSYATQIAALNAQITNLGSSGSSANSLLDQRDQLVSELNELIGVTVSTQDGSSSISLSLSNGVTLVQGDTAYQLATVTSSSDPSRLTLAYDNGTGKLTTLSEDDITGGSIAGLFDAREDIDSTRNALGEIALQLASSFNDLQTSGYDLNGDAGENFFDYNDPDVVSYSTNTGSATLSAVYSDTSEVEASDYKIAFDGTNWTVTKASDGSSVDVTVGTDASSNTTLSFDGLTVTVDGTANANDKFTVNTVSNFISGLSVAISDGSLIAAGSSGGDSDNGNLEKMLALETDKLVNGNSTLAQAYASLIGDVGVKASAAESLSTSQSTIVDTLTERQQSVSGVNLDEEYVNLITYQQYYTACSQILSTAQTTFDTLLSAVSS